MIIDTIRPGYKGDSVVIYYLLGVAPNFFPAIGIPALFIILIPHLFGKTNRPAKNNHIRANILSTTGLLAWEYMQVASKSLHFDWNDILWTLLGAVVFHVIWIFTSPKLKPAQE